MGSSRRGGHPELQLRLVHRLLALASLLLLASGEVIFEERFEGKSDSAQFPSSVFSLDLQLSVLVPAAISVLADYHFRRCSRAPYCTSCCYFCCGA
jgi:hypothetical protein